MADETSATSGVGDAGIPGMELPATFANYFHVYAGQGMTRISFGERTTEGSDIHYRASFTVPNDGAKALAELILRMLALAEAAKSTTKSG